MITSALKNQSRVSELHRVWFILKFTFAIVPIVAGLDKFTNILVDWTHYLSPEFVAFLPLSPEVMMIAAGVIEILAGCLVLFNTEIGSYIVAAWLTLIALTLLLSWHHPDVAVRDLVMAIAAFSLGRLTRAKNESLA